MLTAFWPSLLGTILSSCGAFGRLLGGATVVGNVMYVGNNLNTQGHTHGALYGLDMRTGATLWSQNTDGAMSTPAVANGVVYAGSTDDSMYAYDAPTGVKRWSYRTGGSVLQAPAVANGAVFVSSADGTLYALAAAK